MEAIVEGKFFSGGTLKDGLEIAGILNAIDNAAETGHPVVVERSRMNG